MNENGMGFSYQPAAGGSMGAPDRNAANPQTAVRLLNLRVPRVVGPNAPIPGQLLNATGGGPSDLNMLLRALMASFGGGGKQIVGPGGPAADVGLNTAGPVRPPQMGSMAPSPNGPPRVRPAVVPYDGRGEGDYTPVGDWPTQQIYPKPTLDRGFGPVPHDLGGRGVTPLF